MLESYDVIIAGSGIAGLHAALRLDGRLSVLVLAKGELTLCNSALAQGGVAAVLDRENDTSDLHFHDTMVAGGQRNNPEAVRVLVEEGPANVLNLLGFGVDFDRSQNGALDLTLEGGHCRRRIAHHRDTTGFEIETKLLQAAQARANVTILENTALMFLEQAEGGFRAGVLQGGRPLALRSRFVILGTGGVGQLFAYTTNSAVATGDGIALAAKMGASVSGLSLVQFHPTAFAGQPTRQRFLISESVRGEGAVLLNGRGERFMHRYDPRLELAPRDVVSQAIRKEAERTGSDAFFLDITAEDPSFVRARFPAIDSKCREFGVDITRDKIPVFPCQHYLMGGIDVDLMARTTVPGLYAVGECSHTGVHGGNRLASNSLLEALVFSKRAADDIMSQEHSAPAPGAFSFVPRPGAPVPAEIPDEIRRLVQGSFFITADKAAALSALPRIQELRAGLESGAYEQNAALLEAQSLAAIAELTLTEVTAL